MVRQKKKAVRKKVSRKRVVRRRAVAKAAEPRIQRLTREIARLKEDAAAHEWGIAKTNEGIKILYHELEKKNRQLEELDQMKSDFVSTVSHELRTPMTIIKESISQVLEGLAGEVSADQQQLLTMALNNIERLNRIVNNLLDISKLEAGKVTLHKEKFDLAELVVEVGLSFKPHLKKKGLDIGHEFSGSPLPVCADRDKIIQVFTNLIGNAVKFTEAGKITLLASDRGKHLQCTVRDTGIGMAAEDLPKVFDKFQQFGRQSGSGEKGTGLGLAISKGIVELHQGTIWVESKPGEGTDFIFTLPKAGSGQ